MITFWRSSNEIRNRIYIPKYYDPTIRAELQALSETHYLTSVEELVLDGVLSIGTGDEIGKLAYGTGDIPFVRTSDIANWEIKSSPKQGVSEDIYEQYQERQDVQVGDILLVRDGTYLIGTNCLVTELDSKVLYQSHILKIRVAPEEYIDRYDFFLALNSPIVQRQIRSVQFTADTIDTIGRRFLELVIPIPKSEEWRTKLKDKLQTALEKRMLGKAFIRQAPVLMEEALTTGSSYPITSFFEIPWDLILEGLTQEAVTSEFGHFETFWHSSAQIKNQIYLPKYYDPEIGEELDVLSATCDCLSIRDLVIAGLLEVSTGVEIGKMAYGTGSIPFIRTSDFSDWEIKHDPKQGISREIYEQYSSNLDVQIGDILLVRDGTYLVGSSCIITESDEEMLFAGGLYKLRTKDYKRLSPWLLLGLLNSYIVKRQIRTKQFTRDVIDTIGQRLYEVVLPIPRSEDMRHDISEEIKRVVMSRMDARLQITELSKTMISGDDIFD